MRRFLSLFVCLTVFCSIFLWGCSSNQIDRGKELKDVMETCDSKWSQAFPTGSATFEQVEDYIAGWGGNAGLDITKTAEHYIVLTNKAVKGQKKAPSLTVALSVDPTRLRDNVKLLSLGMTSLLGPVKHGKLRLIVMEATENSCPGAESVSKKYMNTDHYIYLYKGSSAMVYTAGSLTAEGQMGCKATRKKPSYTNAYEISIRIPSTLDPYIFEKDRSMPNPINVIGDLLASAKSSGRLFEIASFTAKDNGDYLPCEAKAVVVIDDNNVEAFKKRFDKSYEAVQKKYDQLVKETADDGAAVEPFSYTMEETDMPEKVLKNRASDNIISLMYTLQTGIHLQDEDTDSITAASYIRSISTSKGRFALVMDMRSRDEASMEEMSGNYLITSGLCDVNYSTNEPQRLWTSKKDSSLAAWFTASVNEENADPIRLQSSECDKLYTRGDKPDLIAYRYDKDHRGTALENILAYQTSLSSQN